MIAVRAGLAALFLGSLSLSMASLSPVVTESGKIRLSVDGAGTNSNSTTIQAQKPTTAATVRKAYLAAATTGFMGTWTIPNGGVTMDGAPVVWDAGKTISSSINSVNQWADVTELVRSKLNTAPAGLVDLTIGEQFPSQIDGEILAVIWSDSTAPDTTVTLLYGAQNIAGDAFTVTLARPIDKSNPDTVLDMSLGISFGFQPTGQYSILELGVNGQRISTSAGGYDDGEASNGALITVGGIGDTNANPANPYQTDSGGNRYDDELYNLLPFVANGATSFTISTRNPSNDDNIFFAAVTLGANTAVVGEGLLLSPASANATLGGTQSATVQVQNTLGQPVRGRSVTFRVVSGPNLGRNATLTTNINGTATFAYSSTLPGTDTIQASMLNSASQLQTSNLVVRNWSGTTSTTRTVTLTPENVVNNLGAQLQLKAKVVNNLGQPVQGVPVTFRAISGPRAGLLGQSLTTATGEALLLISSHLTGTDKIIAETPGPQVSNEITASWIFVNSRQLVLWPGETVAPSGTPFTVTARAFNAMGGYLINEPIEFKITSGPNAGRTVTALTNNFGLATATFQSNAAGTDTVVARLTGPAAGNLASNPVTRVWAGLLCDVDNNGSVNNLDITAILNARNTLVPSGDVRDSDFDGIISVTDSRACQQKCTKSGCAQ